MTTDLLTRIMRTTGASREDAIKVRDIVAEETMQRYLDAQRDAEPAPPAPSQPTPIVVNVYVDDRIREGITLDIVKAMNTGLCDATQQLKRSMKLEV